MKSIYLIASLLILQSTATHADIPSSQSTGDEKKAYEAIKILYPKYNEKSGYLETENHQLKAGHFKTWTKYDQPSLLAILRTRSSGGANSYDLVLAAFKYDGDPMKFLFQSAPEKYEIEEDHGTITSFKLDLAPYEIAKNEFAFGVRIGSELVTTTLSMESEYLVLFRYNMQEKTFIRIAEIPVMNTNEGKHSESNVIVSSKATQGYFDLIARDKKKKSIETIFKWNGSKYEMNKVN